MLDYPSQIMNDMLPGSIRISLAREAEISRNELKDSLLRLHSIIEDNIDPSLISITSRMIHDHMALKYSFDVSRPLIDDGFMNL